MILSLLTITMVGFYYFDIPVGGSPYQSIQVTYSNQNSIWEMTALSAGEPLVGRIDLTVASTDTPSHYQLYLLDEGEYVQWLSVPINHRSQPYYPQAYDYKSGSNVNFYGNKSLLEFPIRIPINSSGVYYIEIYGGFLPVAENGIYGPNFTLGQPTAVQSTQFTLHLPPSVFEIGMVVLGLVMFWLGYTERNARNQPNPLDQI